MLCASFLSGVTAVEVVTEADIDLTAMLEDIPVFISNIATEDEEQRLQLQEEVNAQLDDRIENSAETMSTSSDLSDQQYELLSLQTSDYTVVELTDEQIISAQSNPLFANAFAKIQTWINEGVNIQYINFFTSAVPAGTYSTNASGVISDPESEAAWEAACDYFGTYGGYKFLMFEYCVKVETDHVTPGAITETFNWGLFLRRSLEFLADVYLGTDEMNAGIIVAKEVISAMTDASVKPLSVNYDPDFATFETWVYGYLYTRDVYVQDKLDRADGTAYDCWGSMQESQLYIRYEADIPVSRRTSTTYNYEPVDGLSGVKIYETPGFSDKTAFMATLLEYYNRSTFLIYVYNEELDIDSIATALVS